MAVGVARAVAGARAVAAAVVVTLLTVVAADAELVPAPGPPLPVTLSKACDAPAGDIAAPAPLPRTVDRLRDRSRLKVLAIGSSSTAGIGASSPAKNYPAQFEGILERAFKGLDVTVVNRGVSGEVAATTAERLKTQVALESPDLVLWQVGTNDALSHVPVESFRQTVTETIRWLKQHEVDVVLVGLQYTLSVATDPYYTSIRTSLREMAAAQNVLLVRRFEAMAFLEKERAGTLVSADGLHLNDLGYRCMAEHVARAVVAGAFGAGERRP